MYESFLQRGNRDRLVHVIVRAAPGATPPVRDVQRVLEAMDSSAAVNVQAMQSTLAFAFVPSQVGAALLGVLGVLGLVLAVAGVVRDGGVLGESPDRRGSASVSHSAQHLAR